MSLAIDTYIERGRALLAREAYYEAVLLLSDAVQEHPNDGYLHSLLGSALWEAGRKEQSVSVLYTAARLDSDLECPRLILSFRLREVGRFEEAVEVLRTGLDVCPRSRVLWLREMAQVYCEAKNWSEARELFEQVLAVAPNDERARLGREEAMQQRARPNSRCTRRRAGRLRVGRGRSRRR
jgi:tetratricopeptide (TPR) repeat protein